MLVLEAWGNRGSSLWTTKRTKTFRDKADPSSSASRTSFKASSCIAGVGGGGGEMRRKETKDERRPRKISAVPYFPTSGRPATNPLQHTHTNPPTGKGAEQEGWEKREGTLPDSQTSKCFYYYYCCCCYFYFGYQMIGRLLCPIYTSLDY